MSEKRVAIVTLSPLKGMVSATEQHWADIAETIEDDFSVIFFCLSDKNAVSSFRQFEMHEVKGTPPKWSASDLASLAIVGRRPSLNKDYPELGRQLEEYSPDFIITGEIIIYNFFREYLKRNPKARIILVTDTPEGIEGHNIRMLDYMGYGFMKPLIRKNYVKFHMGIYENMLELSYRIVTTSEYHRKKLQQRYNLIADKIVGINSHFIREVPKAEHRKSVKTILFMGDLGNISNREAVDSIKLIAPKLPEKSFIIAGRNVPKTREGNIEYRGEVSEGEKEALYKAADICIAPMMTSSGKKAKMFDYFLHDKVVIGTAKAFEGFDEIQDGVNAIVEDDIARYPSRINALEQDPDGFMKMQKIIYLLIKGYTKEEIRRSWISVLR